MSGSWPIGNHRVGRLPLATALLTQDSNAMMTRQTRRGLVGATVGAVVGGSAAAAYFASIVLGPQANEPPSPGFYAIVLAPSLLVPGIGWGAWLGWLIASGPRPVLSKLIIPAVLSVPVVLWLLILAGVRL